MHQIEIVLIQKLQKTKLFGKTMPRVWSSSFDEVWRCKLHFFVVFRKKIDIKRNTFMLLKLQVVKEVTDIYSHTSFVIQTSIYPYFFHDCVILMRITKYLYVIP